MPTMEEYLASVSKFREAAGAESFLDNHSLTKVNPYGFGKIDPDAVKVKIYTDTSKLIPDNLPTQAGELPSLASQASYLHRELSRTDIAPERNPVIRELVKTARDVATEIAIPTPAAKRAFNRQMEFSSTDPNATKTDNYEKPKGNTLHKPGEKNMKDLPDAAVEHVAETLAVAEARIKVRDAINANPNIEKNGYTRTDLEPDLTKHAIEIATEKKGLDTEPKFDSARIPNKDGTSRVRPEFEAAWKLPEIKDLVEKVGVLHEKMEDYAKTYNATHGLTHEEAEHAETMHALGARPDKNSSREFEDDAAKNYQAGVDIGADPLGSVHQKTGSVGIEDLHGKENTKGRLMEGGITPEEANVTIVRPLSGKKLTEESIESMPIQSMAEKQITDKAIRNYVVISSANAQSDMLKSYIDAVIKLDKTPGKISKMTPEDWKKVSDGIQDEWNNPETYKKINIEHNETLTRGAYKALLKPDETLEHLRTREGVEAPFPKAQHIQMTDMAQALLTVGASGKLDTEKLKEKGREIQDKEIAIASSKSRPNTFGSMEDATRLAEPIASPLSTILEREHRNPEISAKNNATLASFRTLGEISQFGKNVLSQINVEPERTPTKVAREFGALVGPDAGQRTPEQDAIRAKISQAFPDKKDQEMNTHAALFTKNNDLTPFAKTALAIAGVQPNNSRENIEESLRVAIGPEKGQRTPQQEQTRQSIEAEFKKTTGKTSVNLDDPKTFDVISTAASYAANSPDLLPDPAKRAIIHTMVNQGYDPKWGRARRNEIEKSAIQDPESFLAKTETASRMGTKILSKMNGPLTENLPTLDKIAGPDIIRAVTDNKSMKLQDAKELHEIAGSISTAKELGNEILIATNLEPHQIQKGQALEAIAQAAGIDKNGHRLPNQTEKQEAVHTELLEIGKEYNIPAGSNGLNMKLLANAATFTAKSEFPSMETRENAKEGALHAISESREPAARKELLSEAVRTNENLIPGFGQNHNKTLEISDTYKTVKDALDAGKNGQDKTTEGLAARYAAMSPEEKGLMLHRSFKETFEKENARAEQTNQQSTTLEKAYLRTTSEAKEREFQSHTSLKDYYQTSAKIEGVEGQLWYNAHDPIKESLQERLGVNEMKHKPLVTFTPPETPFGETLINAAKEAGYVVIPGKVVTSHQNLQFTREKETIEGAGSKGANNELINAGQTRTTQTTLLYKDAEGKDRVFNPEAPPRESMRPRLYVFDPHDETYPKKYSKDMERPSNKDEYTRIALASSIPGKITIFADVSRNDNVPFEIAKAHSDIKTAHTEALLANDTSMDKDKHAKTIKIDSAEIIDSRGETMNPIFQKKMENERGNRQENILNSALARLDGLDVKSQTAVRITKNILAYGRENGIKPASSAGYVPTPQKAAESIIGYMRKNPGLTLGKVIATGMDDNRDNQPQTLSRELAQSFKILPSAMVRSITKLEEKDTKTVETAKDQKLRVTSDRNLAYDVATPPGQKQKPSYALIGDAGENTTNLNKQYEKLIDGLVQKHGRDANNIANFTIHTTMTPGLGEVAINKASELKVPVIAHTNQTPRELETPHYDPVKNVMDKPAEYHLMMQARNNADHGLGGFVTKGDILAETQPPAKIHGIYLSAKKGQALDESSLLTQWGENGPTFRAHAEEAKRENLRGIITGTVVAKTALATSERENQKARSLGEKALSEPGIAKVVGEAKTVADIRANMVRAWGEKDPEFNKSVEKVTQKDPVAMRNLAASIHSALPGVEHSTPSPTIDMSAEKNIPAELKANASKHNITLATTEEELNKARQNGSAIIKSPFKDLTATHENEGVLQGIKLAFGNGKTSEPVLVSSKDRSITQKAAAIDESTNRSSDAIRKSITFASMTYDKPNLAENQSPVGHLIGYTIGVKEVLGNSSNKDHIDTPEKKAGYELGKSAAKQALAERPNLKTHTIAIDPAALPDSKDLRSKMLATMEGLKTETASAAHPVEAKKTDLKYDYAPNKNMELGVTREGHTIPGTEANAEKMLADISKKASEKNQVAVIDIRMPKEAARPIPQTDIYPNAEGYQRFANELKKLAEVHNVKVVSNDEDMAKLLTQSKPGEKSPRIYEAQYKMNGAAISERLTPSNLVRDTIDKADAVIVGPLAKQSPAMMPILEAGQKKPIATLGPADNAATISPDMHAGTKTLEQAHTQVTKVMSMTGAETERQMTDTKWERDPSLAGKPLGTSIHAVATTGLGAPRLDNMEKIAAFTDKAKDASLGVPTQTMSEKGMQTAHPERGSTTIAMLGGHATPSDKDIQQIDETLAHLKEALGSKLHIATTLQPGYNEKVIQKARSMDIPVTVHTVSEENAKAFPEKARISSDIERLKGVNIQPDQKEYENKNLGINTSRILETQNALQHADGVVAAHIEHGAPEIAAIAKFGANKPVAVLPPEKPGKENAGSNLLVHPQQDIQAFLDTNEKGDTITRTGRNLHSYPEQLAQNTKTTLIAANTGAGATIAHSPEAVEHFAASVSAIKDGREIYSLNGEKHAARTMDGREQEDHNKYADPAMIRYKTLEQVMMDKETLKQSADLKSILNPSETKIAQKLLRDVESLNNNPTKASTYAMAIETELEEANKKTKEVTNNASKRRARQSQHEMD